MTTVNTQKIIEYISLFKGVKITEKTLLIFEEIQECFNIISSLKYFCHNFHFIPVVATSSMVQYKSTAKEIERERSDMKIELGFRKFMFWAASVLLAQTFAILCLILS